MKNKGSVNILLIIGVVAVIGAAVYLALNEMGADERTYVNSKYGFELKYPSTWDINGDVLRFVTENGYAAVFGVEDITPVAKDYTIDEMRSEYDRTVASNLNAPKAAEVLKNISIGNESGLEWAGIGCEQSTCSAKYEFYSNGTWRKGFKFYLLIANLKVGDVNSSFDPRPLFGDDAATIRYMLSTLEFVR